MSESKIKSKCPVELYTEVMGSKWKILIIWHLRDGPLRFSALRNKLHGVNSKTLTTHLRELEELKILSRTVFAEVPPRVDYSLTSYGRKLSPVFDAMWEWARQYLESEGIKTESC